MLAVLSFLRSFTFPSVLLRLLVAALCGGLIGFERGRQRRAAGLRTHILVALGAALTVIVGLFARQTLGITDTDPLRIAAQVISGIGFLGVGTILLKGRFQITGLTTAAGLWVTAAIGIALGVGYYEGALLGTAVTVMTIVLLHRLERTINDHHASFGIYLEIRSDAAVRAVRDLLSDTYGAHDLQVTLPRSGKEGNVGIEASFTSTKRAPLTSRSVIDALEEHGEVVYAIESI